MTFTLLSLLTEDKARLTSLFDITKLPLIKKFENSYKIDHQGSEFKVFNEESQDVETINFSALTANEKDRLKKLQNILDDFASDDEVTNILFLTKNSSGFVLKFLEQTPKSLQEIKQQNVDIASTKKLFDGVFGSLATPIEEAEPRDLDSVSHELTDQELTPRLKDLHKTENKILKFTVFNEESKKFETINLSDLTQKEKKELQEWKLIVNDFSLDVEVKYILCLTKNDSGFSCKYLKRSPENLKEIAQQNVDLDFARNSLDLVFKSSTSTIDLAYSKSLSYSQSCDLPQTSASDEFNSQSIHTPRLSKEELNEMMQSKKDDNLGVNAKFQFNFESENNAVIKFSVLPNSNLEINANELIDLYLKFRNDNDDENKKIFIFYDQATDSFKKKDSTELESSDKIEEKTPSIYEIGFFLKSQFPEALQKRSHEFFVQQRPSSTTMNAECAVVQASEQHTRGIFVF